MNKEYEMVREFHNAFGVNMPTKPQMLDRGNEVAQLALEMYAANLAKIVHSMKLSNHSSEVLKRASWMIEEAIELMTSRNIEGQADALGDSVYFGIGGFTLMGIEPAQIFAEINAANMRKLGPDKMPIYDAQGKIRKPEGWEGPEKYIAAEIERQANEKA